LGKQDLSEPQELLVCQGATEFLALQAFKVVLVILVCKVRLGLQAAQERRAHQDRWVQSDLTDLRALQVELGFQVHRDLPDLSDPMVRRECLASLVVKVVLVEQVQLDSRLAQAALVRPV